MSGFSAFMAGWGWVIFSLFAAVFSGAIYLTNQYFRQEGHVLVFWMRVMVTAAMTPFMLLVDLPTDGRFYAAVAATVFLGSSADIRIMNVAARYGGGVVSRLQPFAVFLTFFLWLAFDPALIRHYAETPINTAGIVAALAGCVYFSNHLSRCAVSKAAFAESLPALLGYTVVAALNKYAMMHGAMTSAVFGYMYAQSLGAVFFVGPYAFWRERRAGRTLRMPGLAAAMAAAVMGLGWIGHMVFKNYAMVFAENPSYQGAVNLTTPVFIALFYRSIRHKEDADVLSGMGVVVCAMLLGVMTVHGH